MRTTGIEWTDHTWNPFVGCSKKSAGCTNCYAIRTAERLESFGQVAYKGITKRSGTMVNWSGKVRRNSDSAVGKPLRVKEPSIFFVNSMSDFWHIEATDEMRLEALSIMETASQHQYQILTKRPENILPFLKRTGYKFKKNMWLGTTVEDSRVVERIDYLREVPAHIRFLSVEPLIGSLGKVSLRGIHWVITGGESGPGARECNPEWIREVRDLCIDQGVPHFFKQWGHEKNNPQPRGDKVGKGGSRIDGRYFKQMPEGFSVSEYK